MTTKTTLYADLHIHTTVSDGSESFEQVLVHAKAQGLNLIACTNHDTLKGVTHALSLQDRYGIGIIGGIEISAWDTFAQTKAHILGLGFTHEDAPAIKELCAPLLERRHAATLWQLEQLIEYGYDIDPVHVYHLAKESTGIYKQHLMAALTSALYDSSDYQVLYRFLFKNGGICDRAIEYVDARDAVTAIKEDGGLAVLAHPGLFNNYELVKHLVPLGLDGLERYHPEHNAQDWSIVNQLAQDHSLFCTGGSDYHGSYGKVTHLGALCVSQLGCDPLASFLSSALGTYSHAQQSSSSLSDRPLVRLFG